MPTCGPCLISEHMFFMVCLITSGPETRAKHNVFARIIMWHAINSLYHCPICPGRMAIKTYCAKHIKSPLDYPCPYLLCCSYCPCLNRKLFREYSLAIKDVITCLRNKFAYPCICIWHTSYFLQTKITGYIREKCNSAPYTRHC